MYQLIKGRDNFVLIPLELSHLSLTDGLNDFESLVISISNETYNTVDDSAKFEIADSSTIKLAIGDVTQLLPDTYFPEIIGYSDLFNDGLVICSRKLIASNNNLSVKISKDAYLGNRPEVNPLTNSSGALLATKILYAEDKLYVSNK